MKDRTKAVPAVYLLLEREGKVLLARRYNTGYQDGNYNVPSGHIEGRELPQAAIMREAKEEIGIDLNEEDLIFAYASYRPEHDQTGNRVDLYFKATRWDGQVKNAEPDKCDDLKWVDPDELPHNMTPHVRQAIQDIRRGIIYSELGKDFLKENGVYMLKD